MIKQLTERICALPTLSKLSGGVTLDYSSGKNSGLCIKPLQDISLEQKFLDGTELLSRSFIAELYVSFSGTTKEQLENRLFAEELEQDIINLKFNQTPEFKIVRIEPASSGTAVKSSVGEGLLCFKFKVYYKTRLRRCSYDNGNPV